MKLTQIRSDVGFVRPFASLLGWILLFFLQSGHANSLTPVGKENCREEIEKYLDKSTASSASQSAAEVVFAPKFLTYDQVISLHKMQIEKFGGSLGLRDEGLLHSALAQPEGGFGDQYFHKDLYEMAAAYLYHIGKNHAFIDGNKRIAALTATVFLEVNGLRVTASEEKLEKLVLDTAQGLVTKEQISEFFKSHTKKQ